MIIKFFEEDVNITFYAQDLYTANLGEIYGKEILLRASSVLSKNTFSTIQVVRHIESDEELSLNLIKNQLELIETFPIEDTFTFWINVSGVLISNNYIFDRFKTEILEKLNSNVKKKLVLEISEHDSNGPIAQSSILSLKEEGYIIALDDFGSGYSNLLKLSDINFDFIKIDLSLIENVPQCLRMCLIYQEIINLCSSTGSLIVAEGIENKEQSDFVRWLGVDILQGYLLSKPYKIQSPDNKSVIS